MIGVMIGVKATTRDRKKPTVLLCPICGHRLTPNKGWAARFYDGYCNYCDMPVDDAVTSRDFRKEVMEMGNKIYSVSFHVMPGRKVHTFWFTDKGKALRFYESVKTYPKVIDYSILELPANETDTYDGTIEEGRIRLVKV